MTDDAKMQAGDNPADFTVDQVNDYLATDLDPDERTRVLASERDEGAGGKARVGILAAYDDASDPDGDGGTPEDEGGVYDEAVTREGTDAFIIPSFNTVPQALQDEDATARNQELEDAGVNHSQGFIGSDGASNLLS